MPCEDNLPFPTPPGCAEAGLSFSPPLAIPIDANRKYSNLHYMKATLDIPDDLYRRVKARSAMEGRPVRSVAVQLFQKWLDGPSP